ncbi:hypothetical protein Gasu_41100 isoform 1 [Galdieria sulphuraria]|uniref:Uncharacterized protein n=1 Tax=Galdieria sulphuraria TaxID=130081 RepID=M2XXS6_GALSU|nr:hypothetical protein Gasu_41100 isoform 1 [Galdieria sulphuraria]EME28418.1 hypothetical protein isoform 1 [Galdieria sulphuraria]|eukprot:XP_005704938.1 hypothetical protein isoform 1 [Galdieria sulphuraria]
MVKKRTRPRTIIRLRRLDNRKIKRIASIIVMGWLCWILYKGILQTRDNRRQAYFHQILDSVVKGTIPKGPIRFLYYDNILTQCDCPYLPQGVIDPTYYAAILSSYGENNHSNRPWEAIYAMPGISHARTNLACLLEEASLLGAIAVLPAVCLSPIHNHDRLIRTHWSRYLYMERLEQGFPIVWNVSLLEKKLQDSFQVYASWPYPLRWNCVLSINYTFTMDDGKNIRKSPEQIFASNHEKYPSTAIFSEKTPTLLLQQSKANILIRQFHTNQEYMACSSFSSWNHPKIQNVWSYFWSSAETDPLPAVQYIRSLYDASESFLCLHLRRGDKLKESRYPCLDVLTRGPHIYSVLQNASIIFYWIGIERIIDIHVTIVGYIDNIFPIYNNPNIFKTIIYYMKQKKGYVPMQLVMWKLIEPILVINIFNLGIFVLLLMKKNVTQLIVI